MIGAACALVVLVTNTLASDPSSDLSATPSVGVTQVDLGLQLAIAPSNPTLGINQEVNLTITAAPETTLVVDWQKLQLRTNAGELQDVTPTSPTTVQARLVLPTRRAPQGLIVAARIETTGEPLVGALFVPLPAVASPAFQTDPHAEVTLNVAGRVFGPKRANAAGEVRVPVVVPPGTPIALVRSTNARGKVAEEVLELGVPPFVRLLVMAPLQAVHMQPVEVLVFGITDTGQAAASGSLALSADDRHAQPLQTGPGWTRFLASAPLLSAQPQMLLRARNIGEALSDDVAASARAKVSLAPGPPSRLLMIPDRVHLGVGSSQQLTLVVRAEDMWGHPTSTATTKLYLNGQPALEASRDNNRLRLVVPAPATAPPQSMLVLEAIDGSAYARHEVVLYQAVSQPLPPAPTPRKEFAWAALAGAGPVLGTDMGAGIALGVEAQLQPIWHSRWPQGLFIITSIDYLRHQRNIQSNTGLSRLGLHALPVLAGAAWRVNLQSNVSLFLGLQAGASRVWMENQTLGASAVGSAWTSALRASAKMAFGAGHSQMTVGISVSDIPGVTLSSGDKLRGNLGGSALALGVRHRW